MRKFNPTSSHPARAVQAWQILVNKAMNRQTITYRDLSRLMYRRTAAGVLNSVLGHIAFYCADNRLPPLTSIVVGMTSGTPAHNIPLDLTAVDQSREKVYGYDWYGLYPPPEKELSDSHARHMAAA